jgi:putative PIN family toxin of toxin-antitoxin system
MRSKKIILDTNLWISFLISKRLEEIDDLLFDGSIKLIFSNESVEEFLTVAKRPKFEKYFADNNINDLLRLFDKYGKLINVSVKIAECRDYKDNFLLNLAVESKADYLVSGDIDLLVLRKIKNTRIISWSDFIKRFRK